MMFGLGHIDPETKITKWAHYCRVAAVIRLHRGMTLLAEWNRC